MRLIDVAIGDDDSTIAVGQGVASEHRSFLVSPEHMKMT